MIKSMTGFAYNEATVDNYAICVEIKAYNSKSTDIAVRMPQAFRALEDNVRAYIAKYFGRGRVEVKITLENIVESDNPFSVNWDKAEHFDKTLAEIATRFDAPVKDKLRLLLSYSGMLGMAESNINFDKVYSLLEPVLAKSLADLLAMQNKEGVSIKADLNQHLDIIEKLAKEIEPYAASLIETYRDKLQERIKALTDNVVELDQTRLAQEAAYLADKADISEEIQRAHAHIEHFRHIMAADEASGRKLNFLLQELNREFNTMGSKIANSDAAHKIVEAKSEIEKIREQVQNIE